jgi:hypothetical protein
MDSRESRRPFQVVLAIAALLIIAATLTLRTVAHPAVLQPSSDNPTPLGYTWSLLLFIIPIAALGWWFASRPDLKFPRAAFWRTIAVLVPVGFLLDLLFGNAFFVFPNKPATLGIDIPARGGARYRWKIRILSDRFHARAPELHLVRRILDGGLRRSGL